MQMFALYSEHFYDDAQNETGIFFFATFSSFNGRYRIPMLRLFLLI